MSAKRSSLPQTGPCAMNCEGCRLGKHGCGGSSCDGWGCCACQGESSLAIHADIDQGGCRDPHTWDGDALLKWYAGGQLTGSEKITFRVECSALPEDDGLTDVEMRGLVTLQLVCDLARRRYGAPPGVIDLRISEDPMPSLVRARWRLDSGGYCHGHGIMNVAAPPTGARLANLRTGSLDTV